MSSIIPSKDKNKRLLSFWAVVFWLALWQIGASLIGEELLLVSPVRVVLRLLQMSRELSFWKAISFSFVRICSGFFLALLFGTVFASLSYRFSFIGTLLSPLMKAIKAIPVASFIILVLIWVPSRNLSVVISFLMVLPLFYINVLEGLESTSNELLEMAKLFNVSTPKRIRSIYLSQIMPFFRSACSLGMGMSWKSGIAAEVIGIPVGSMGENLYQAKVFLATADLFTWTLVIVLVSVVFEHLVLFLLDRCFSKIERLS